MAEYYSNITLYQFCSWNLFLIINDSNMTNKYWDMVPDGQKCRRTDGVDGRMHGDDAKIYPSDFVGG